MNRRAKLSIAVFFILGMLSIVLPISAHTIDDPFIVDLIAGQHIDAGDILVWNDHQNLFVKYSADPPWCITEVHLAVGATVDEIPQNKNHNPIPGKFSYSGTYAIGDCVQSPDPFVIPLQWNIEESIVIAAHAELTKPGEQRETGWGDGTQFGGHNWGMYFGYTIQEPYPD